MRVGAAALLAVLLALSQGARAAEWLFGPRVEFDVGGGFAFGAGVFVGYLPLQPVPELKLGASVHGGAVWLPQVTAWTGAATLHVLYAPVFARLGWWGELRGVGLATGPYLAVGATGALDRVLDWAVDASLTLDVLGAGTTLRLGAMLLVAR